MGSVIRATMIKQSRVTWLRGRLRGQIEKKAPKRHTLATHRKTGGGWIWVGGKVIRRVVGVAWRRGGMVMRVGRVGGLEG